MNYLTNPKNIILNKCFGFIRFIKFKINKNKLLEIKRNKYKKIILIFTKIFLLFAFYNIENYTQILKNFANYKEYYNNILPKLNLDSNNIPSLKEIFNNINQLLISFENN